MELRFRLALVIGGGSARGRDVALRLARVGAGVLVADARLDQAQETAVSLREHRVWAAPVGIDTCDEDDVRLLAARVRDLGGVSYVLDTAGGPYVALLRGLLAETHPAPVWLDHATLEACTGREAISLLRAG